MKWKSIAAVLFLSSLAATAPTAAVSYAASPSYSAITQAVQSYVHKDAAARNFNLLSVHISTPQVQQTGTTVTFNYVATTTHTLNFASADDSPVVKGIHGFLANNPGLSVAAKTPVQSLLASWKTRIQGYIDNPFTSNEYIEATASVDSAGNVIPGTIRVFSENPDGSLIPEAQELADIPSNSVVQSRFESDPKGTAVSPSGTGSPVNLYSASAAVNYANQYVNNACYTLADGSNNCGPTCREFPSYYNHAYWYDASCDDCANFVSQAMAAGGIPEVQGTSGWYEPTDGTTEGNYAWVNAGGLADYMTTHDGDGVPYWSQLSSESYVVPGDTLEESNYGHTMIATYADGTSLYWNGHTNDDYHVKVSSSYGYFYEVSDWSAV